MALCLKSHIDGGRVHQLTGDQHLVLAQFHIFGDAEGGEQLLRPLLRGNLLLLRGVQGIHQQLGHNIHAVASNGFG